MSVAEPASTGLETAAERLYERNSSRVYGYCLKMLGSREEAEDASQTTFMQAFRALQRGVVPAFETAWLLAIAKNVCRARHRAGGRRKAVELARDPQDLEQLAGGPERDDGSLVGLQDALARLPEMQRRAFLLREWQGRSYAEIALELGVTVPSVEALIFRARRALAHQLGGEERRRGHAFDLASLVAAVKSLLGGGAAVKLAVGAAVAVGVGAVAGGATQRSEQPEPAGAPVHVSKVEPNATPLRRVSAPLFPRRPKAVRPTAAGRTTPGSSVNRVTPATPALLPAAEGPAPPRGEPSTTAPPVVPDPPAVPDPPTVPDPPVVPDIPGVPPLPEVPDLPVPQVELPPAPTDELPVDVPELPAVPDVPGLPDVPTLP